MVEVQHSPFPHYSSTRTSVVHNLNSEDEGGLARDEAGVDEVDADADAAEHQVKLHGRGTNRRICNISTITEGPLMN